MSGRGKSPADARLVDRRALGARLAARLWRRASAPPFWARALGGLTGRVNRAVLARRVARRGAAPPGAPLVVSLGSLSVGGAGKTPIAADLAARLDGQGIHGAIALRGWGSRERGPRRVRADDARAADEARLLATAAPGWAVIQAADRAAGLAAALALEPAPRVVLLEDGHQSAGVWRHLDILIVERWTQDAAGRMRPVAGPRLPWGPWREGIEGARRAGVWLVEADAGVVPEEPAGDAEARPGIRVLTFRRRAKVRGGSALAADAAWGAVSGVARPEAFEADCARLRGAPPALVVRHDDHHGYRERDVQRLLRDGAASGVAVWLTTAKDAVKLAALWPRQAPPLLTVELAIEWTGNATLPDLVGEWLARHEGRV